MATVREQIAWILRAFGLSEQGLAKTIGVSQSAISRWYNEQATPTEEHRVRLEGLYAAAKNTLVTATREFRYICSFAPTYTNALEQAAHAALRGALPSLNGLNVHRRTSGANIDFHIRAATLSQGARAHTFEDAADGSRVFVVLVHDALSEQQQLQVAFDEAYAHVMRRLIDRSRSMHAPIPVLRLPQQNRNT
jgi:predicted transcriptional regulator